MTHVRRARSNSGAVLAEGVVALSLIVAGVVLGTLLLVNVGIASYYKEKLGLVTNQVAVRLARHISWNSSFPKALNDTEEATTVANSLLTAMGLPKAKTVTVVSKSDFVTVTIVVDGFPMFGQGTVIPVKISLQDTAAAAFLDDQPPALLNITDGNGQGLVVPCYGKFVAPFSNGQASDLSKAPPGVAVFQSFSRGYDQFGLQVQNSKYQENQSLINPH